MVSISPHNYRRIAPNPNKQSTMTRDILINDRLWFDSYPFAIVRFRRQHAEEFATLVSQNQQAPVFLPSFCTTDRVLLTWVAVVDVFQLLRDCNASGDGTRLRLRMQTPPFVAPINGKEFMDRLSLGDENSEPNPRAAAAPPPAPPPGNLLADCFAQASLEEAALDRRAE